MEEIIAPNSKEILKAELNEEKRLRVTNKLHLQHQKKKSPSNANRPCWYLLHPQIRSQPLSLRHTHAHKTLANTLL